MTPPPTRAICFTIPGSPRTKKTSQRIVKMGAHSAIIPSKQYLEWLESALSYGPLIRQEARQQLPPIVNGVRLPITGPVSVCAIFYRDALRGDATGFYQALADALQEPCNRPKRKGLGIILDDKQIVHWDGSRLAKDKSNPRIEVEITIL